MDSSIVNDGGLHHQLIPHRDQSAAYGISSSSSVHPSTLLPDKFPPPPIDPLAVFWHNHPSLHLPPQDNHQMAVASFPYNPTPAFAYETQDDSVPPGTREKRHCCRLCNKRFDRPSTLKKHMLVHTGEKAWACEICGRRFSVSSNLNRHARRCREKWAKADSLATDTPPPSALSDPPEHTESSPPSSSSSSSPSSDGSDAYRQPSPQLTDQQKRRQPAPGTVQYEIDDGTRSHDQQQQHVAGKPYKARRRKGSPTEPWVPASLVNFNHDPVTSSLPTPLPAVVPSTFEERNSYEDTPLQAYHPSLWAGRLVGPSYTFPPGSDGVSRGRYYGKLLVF